MNKGTVGFLLAAAVLVLLAGPVFAVEFVDIPIPAGVGDDGLGKGVAFADINNDGLVDLFLSNKGGYSKLFLNQGDGRFEEITAKAGLGDAAAGFIQGSAFGDFDNDGFVDLYLAKGGQTVIEANRLFRNNGDNTFTDVTAKAGVGLTAFTYGASWADYDNDGWIDLYCANYGVGAENILYRNNGDGTFSDVTDVAGVGDVSWSWMGVWADVNNDNFPDLYVVNGRFPEGEPNKLYINNRNGTFTERARAAGVDDPKWGLGAAFGDVDNDGDQDLFVSNYIGGNQLYLNQGNGSFVKASHQVRLPYDGWGKGPSFGDVDNDGDLDLYKGDCKLANQIYLNDGKGRFTNVADQMPILKCEGSSTEGTAFADIDNDGDLDLFVVKYGSPSRLFKNLQNDRNWLKIKLIGTVSNRDAYGSKVKIYESGRDKLLALRETRSATGFCAQEPNLAHFGLSAARTYDVIAVFPSGIEVRLSGVHTGQTLEIIEPSPVQPIIPNPVAK